MINLENIEELQNKFSLSSYHVRYAYIAEQLIGLQGKKVLEVGGSLPARFCLDVIGASQWISIDQPEYWHEVKSKQSGGEYNAIDMVDHLKYDQLNSHTILNGSIENLPDDFMSRFDCIFSIAAFEHIHTLGLALEKMHQALKPGGRVFATCSQVWSAYDGHHLPNIYDESGQLVTFDACPIPPWGHLLMRPQQLYYYLTEKMDKKMAAKIVYYTYHSSHINRLFIEDYIEYFHKSPFHIERINMVYPVNSDHEHMESIQKYLKFAYPNRNQFIHNGLHVVLDKADAP